MAISSDAVSARVTRDPRGHPRRLNASLIANRSAGSFAERAHSCRARAGTEAISTENDGLFGSLADFRKDARFSNRILPDFRRLLGGRRVAKLYLKTYKK